MAVKVFKCSLALILIYPADLTESYKQSQKPREILFRYDITKFYMPGEYIWTTNGTITDECILCKFDNVTYNTETYALFTRNYTIDEVTVIMKLKGTFERLPYISAPFRMDVTVQEETYVIEGQNYSAQKREMSHMEVLLYADDDYKCGVFLNKFRKYTYKPKHGEDYLYTEDPLSCEIRVKSTKKPSKPSPDCWKAFTQNCRETPYFDVYQDFCWKPKLPAPLFKIL